MNSKKLIKKIWKMFPIKTAKKYHDFVGLMEGHLREETNTIITCLDVSPEVVDKAIECNADLIISHHPFIYGKKKFVLLDPYKKNMYDTLEEHNIPVYSFHTNFDEGKGGMNDALSEALGLSNVRPIPTVEMARMGELPYLMKYSDFAKYVLEKLHMDYCQMIGNPESVIKTVGILGGAGSRTFEVAIKNGCDVYISGDTPYYVRKEAIDKKINYLHVDHEVEKIFIPAMKKILLGFDSSLNVIECDDVRQTSLITK